MNKNVFVSYGHGIYDKIVKRVVDDLREQEFQVFLDTDYLHLGNWEAILDKHILGSSFFVFMISAKSVSEHGYCLNELCRAGECNATIIPVKLDESLAPLSINKYQRLMLINCIDGEGNLIEGKYQEFLKEMVDILSGNAKVGFVSDDNELLKKLRPMSSREDLFRHYSQFCGRKSAFEDFERFVESDKNFLWIPASPGSGKTAFSSMLCWKYPHLIKAIHFCKFNNSDRINPKYILTSTAYHLSNAYPEYKVKLLSLINDENLLEKNADRLFEYLFIEPLSTIHLDSPIVIVFDALDECSLRGKNELAELLARYKNSLPKWLKFVVTSRDEIEIRRVFLNMGEAICRSFESNNYGDLKEYYHLQFPEADEMTLNILLQKSEGSFLYAYEISKQIKSEHLSLDAINYFPVGIYGFFNDCLNRIFTPRGDEKKEDILSFETVRPILELLCIANEPIDMPFLMEVLPTYDEYTMRRILGSLSSLFPLKNGYIEPLHKSLVDWLTQNEDFANIYYINQKNGYLLLYQYLKKVYQNNQYKENIRAIKYFGQTLIRLEKYDELFDLLSDLNFQTTKIRVLQFDSGLDLYIQELKTMCDYDLDQCMDLLEGKTFIHIFSEHRRLLYNSGMFHQLKKLGLTNVLKRNADDWGLDGEIGKIMYYYIVENFNTAISKIKALLRNHPEIKEKHDLLAEIYNTKGLSERKLVLFDDALESLDLAIENGEIAMEEVRNDQTDPEFEVSLAHLIKGKIYSRQLNFSSANRAFKLAIRVLENKIEEMPDCDKKISNILFLAEDYRVYADACIWEDKKERALENLKKCEEIYNGNRTSVDRYYVRYRYTSLFYEIIYGDREDIEDELMDVLKETGGGKYDVGQIYFLSAMNTLLHHNQDVDALENALENADKGSDLYFSIGATMEEAECRAMKKMICQKLHKSYDDDDDLDEEEVKEWIAHIVEFLEGKVKVSIC